jgi:hypothetical protein
MTPYDIDPETAKLITPGMTEKDVIVILKAPPGWYAGRNRDYLRGPALPAEIFTSAGALMRDGEVVKGWGGYNLMVAVSFDKQGRVDWCYTTPVFGFGWEESFFHVFVWEESFFQMVRRWCHLN